MRRTWHLRLAGFHVRLFDVSRVRQGLHGQCRQGGRGYSPAVAPPRLPGAMVRQQRAGAGPGEEGMVEALDELEGLQKAVRRPDSEDRQGTRSRPALLALQRPFAAGRPRRPLQSELGRRAPVDRMARQPALRMVPHIFPSLLQRIRLSILPRAENGRFLPSRATAMSPVS